MHWFDRYMAVPPSILLTGFAGIFMVGCIGV
jgi:hypothetical protein